MPVQFSCKACKKKFKAADKFAGKTIPCPSCKNPILVPASPPEVQVSKISPSPAPVKAQSQSEQDIEAMAAAALEDSKQDLEETPQSIQFECTFCDEKISVGVDLGGKQTPCPGCRRILKVPMPVPTKKTGPDWKKQPDKRPAGALKKEEPQLEGTWNSTMDNVSRDALLEAGAIVEEFEPLTRAEKIKRAIYVLVAIFMASTGYLFWNSYKTKANEDAQVALIESSIKSGELSKASGEIKSVILSGIASYRLSESVDVSAPKIKKTLQSSLASLEKSGSLVEKDFALLELCKSITQLGGGKDDVQANKRLKWDEVQKFLMQSFDGFSNPEMKLLALRNVTLDFISAGEIDRAIAFVSQVLSGVSISKDKKFDEYSDFLAVVGVELHKAQKMDAVKQITDMIRNRYLSTPTTLPSPFAAALFSLADKEKPGPFALPKEAASESDLVCLLCVALVDDKLDSMIVSSNLKSLDGIIRLNCLVKISFLSSIIGKDTQSLNDELNRVVAEGLMPNNECVQSYIALSGITRGLKISTDSWAKASEKVPQAVKEFKQIKSLFLLASLIVRPELTSATIDEINKIEAGSLARSLAYMNVGLNQKNLGWFKPYLLKTTDPDKSSGYMGIALSADKKAKKS